MKDWSLVGIIIGIIIILGGAVCEQIYLENLSQSMINEVDEIERLFIVGDIESSKIKLQNTMENWEKTEKVLEIMINHQDVRKISETLIEIDSKLKDFLNSNNVSSNFALLKEYIISIKEGSEFTISNVL